MQKITSLNNDYIKAINKLKQSRYQKEQQQFLIEGKHLVEEAIRSSSNILSILITEDNLNKFENLQGTDLYLISDHIAEKLSDVRTNQGIFAVIENQKLDFNQINMNKVIILDELQDPGNVGTIIRTADAAGYDTVIVSQKTVNPFTPKTLRSMQGSNFHLNLVQSEIITAIEKLQSENITVLASDLNPDSISYKEVGLDSDQKRAIVLGNEGNGINDAVRSASDATIHIPMNGKAESLNVGVAAGILMFTI